MWGVHALIGLQLPSQWRPNLQNIAIYSRKQNLSISPFCILVWFSQVRFFWPKQVVFFTTVSWKITRMFYRNVLKRPRGQAQLDCGITHSSTKATLVTIDPNLHKKKIIFDPSRWVIKNWIFVNIFSDYGWIHQATFKTIRSDIKSRCCSKRVKIVPPPPPSTRDQETCVLGDRYLK